MQHRQVQAIIDEIDRSIRARESETLTLERLARYSGYSPSHVSRMFYAISGMHLRQYLCQRRLAFTLKELRETQRCILPIALDYGFSSHEAFTRAFRAAYGMTPSAYRANPTPVVLRTILRPFDCYLLEHGGDSMNGTSGDVKTYFISIPAHKFLHIRNYESIGYWDFWEKQSHIPGQDCETICGLLSTIPDRLDDFGGMDADSSSGQVMAFINEPQGRLCSWGIPLAEAYGVRLPADYSQSVPDQMMLMDVPEGEYIVFEHGPFDFETQNPSVEEKIEAAMKDFDYAAAGYQLDHAQGRVFYFYHDCTRYWKYVRPVRRISKEA